MTTNTYTEFQVHLFNAETEATTWRITDMDCIANQLQRDIYDMTSNKQMQFMKEFSIHLLEFKAWWQAIGSQKLWNTIEQHVIHFWYPKVHHLIHISGSILRMGCGNDSITDTVKRLHIRNEKDVYWSTNKVNHIWQLLNHNDLYTGFDYMMETLLYIALQGWYDNDCAYVFKIRSTAGIWRNTHRADTLRLLSCQEEKHFHAVLQLVYYLRETHLCIVYRSDKFTSLRDALVDFGIPNFGQLFCAKIE